MRRKSHWWTEEQKNYLAEVVSGRSWEEIKELINSKFNLDLNITQIANAIKRYGLKTGRTGHFEKGKPTWNKGLKGYIGPNKTSFVKGQIPANYKPVGTRSFRKGYWFIKVADPDVWRLEHKVIWEKEHGKVPSKHALLFLDGDINNVTLENLKLITRRQLLTLNQNDLIQKDAELTKTALNIADVIIKVQELNQR